MLKHIKAQPDWDQKGIGAKGFTLIELLVVIVILGILAAVVVFAVSGISDRGDESACETDLRTVRTASEAYYAENGSYAATEQALVDGGFLSELSDITAYVGPVAPATTPTITPGAACTP